MECAKRLLENIMERIIRWFVNNTVAANMLMLFIMVAGVMTLPRMKMEVFPISI